MTSAFDNPSDMNVGAKNVGEGWWELIREMETELGDLDPDYAIHQVKEKFGGLRYYAECTVERNVEKFNGIISAGEDKSFYICEECGQPGTCIGSQGWIKTLCPEHRQEELSRRKKRFG